MIHSLKTLNYGEKEICYTGHELAPHWIYKTFDLKGDSLVAFQGPADVSLDKMVDLEDVKRKAPIGSPKMLHFLAEFFIDSLDEGVLLQHLFVFEVYEALLQRSPKNLRRRGNDLYFKDRKLSVSIATKSLISVLMHFAINIETAGTPVPTAGLLELGVDPKPFAEEILGKFGDDLQVWANSRIKVSPR